jgi:hypothetical protein
MIEALDDTCRLHVREALISFDAFGKAHILQHEARLTRFVLLVCFLRRLFLKTISS